MHVTAQCGVAARAMVVPVATAQLLTQLLPFTVSPYPSRLRFMCNRGSRTCAAAAFGATQVYLALHAGITVRILLDSDGGP